ncbi:MAG: hypothetical protein LQ338_007369 [Usnochroma carphineum]|nr:MAG: hypothetical protein LQ338_007369 [Usnochroma carphineum]
MADTGPRKHAAESLEDTLALVLKETGKFFRASQSQNSRQLSIAKAAISQTIPAANLRFHNALDNIEVEIIRAKSVFERDLSSIRAKRAARERAAASVLRTKSPNGIVKKSHQNGSPRKESLAAMQANGDQAALKSAATNGTNITDVPMTEEPITINGHESPPEQPEPASDADTGESFALRPELPQDSTQPKGLAISFPQEPLPSNPPAPVTKPDPELNIHSDSPPNGQPSQQEQQQQQQQQQPTSATFPDAQFESLFNDTDLPHATNTVDDLGDFDLTFSTDEVAANGGDSSTDHLLDASAFQHVTLPTTTNNGGKGLNAGDAQQHNPNMTANEDLTALLPGLENYVNGGSDFSNFTNIEGVGEFPIDNDNGNGDIPATTTTTITTQAPPPAMQAPIDSSFEDMFGIDSYMNGTGDDDLGGTGVGDFDEDWFKGEGI